MIVFVVVIVIIDDADLYSDDSEGADVDNVAANDHYHRFDSCSSSAFDSNSGPYSALLQDFTLRSYMSGERKSKPLLSKSIIMIAVSIA